MLIMRSRKKNLKQRNRTTKSRKIGDKETNKYLRILDADIMKQVEMKEKIKNEYLRRTRKRLESKLYRRDPIKGINASPLQLVRHWDHS